MTKKKTLDTGWKWRKQIAGDKTVTLRRRITCEKIALSKPSDSDQLQDIEVTMIVWSSVSGKWSWAVRASTVGSFAWDYLYRESKRLILTKATAKHMAEQEGRELAESIAAETAKVTGTLTVRAIWPEREPPKWTRKVARLDTLAKPLDEDFRERITCANKPAKRQRRMQWPANNAPLSNDESAALLRHIVDAIRRTHEIRRITGSTSDYRGIDEARSYVTDAMTLTNVVEGIAEEEPVFTNLEMVDSWIHVAFVLGSEQGCRLAQSEAMRLDTLAKPLCEDFRARVSSGANPEVEHVVALYRTMLASRLDPSSGIARGVSHTRIVARLAYDREVERWEKAEGELIRESTRRGDKENSE